ncbi:MAG: F0F1 ATP synthase subunit epsilon [Culturomica sp.]|jgi:F-type H+-transporting ATPase subunit epsilon|nr:F0F1 ATP synthase subunit epsilon [Culturomica sp.]
MILQIFSIEKTIFKGEANELSFTGEDGSFAVLDDHAPLIARLGKGEIVYTNSGEQHKVEISGGMLEVRKNEVAVCLD